MINVIVWLILGALVGWLAALRGGPARSRQLNLGLGIIGAVLGGLFFNGFDVGAAASSGPLVDLSGLLVAFIGAISVLTLGNVLQQGHDRHR
jgi:uncharacterized membrane protein YeaQ/YmgE (transglycosylase-associated protein family)